MLLRAVAEPANENADLSDDATLAQCLVSARVVGEEMGKAASCFLTWRIPQMELCGNRASLRSRVAHSGNAPAIRPDRGSDTWENWRNAYWAEESLYRQESPSNPSDPEPLAYGISSGFWKPLAAEFMNEAAAIPAEDAREKIQLCLLILDGFG